MIHEKVPLRPTKCKRHGNLFRLPLLALGFFLGGCDLLPKPQADTVRYFTLSSLPNASVQPGGVLVRPVQLAGHLRNRAMAVRVGEDEVIYLEDVHWAEPLATALTQSLRARLGAVASDAVVSVQIDRFELVRSEGNSVQLAASYSIEQRGEPVQRANFTSSPKTWDGKDYGALVGLLRNTATELGDVLATALSPKK